jgi:hypothetical protein
LVNQSSYFSRQVHVKHCNQKKRRITSYLSEMVTTWPWPAPHMSKSMIKKWYEGKIGNSGRTPGLTTPNLTLSAMGSLVTTESQDGRLFNIPSERQHHTQGNVPNHCPRDTCFCVGPPTQLPAASGLPSWDQPCLASEASWQWDAGWCAAGQMYTIR